MSPADGRLEQDLTSCQRTIDQLQARHHVLCEQEAELPDSASRDITQLEALLNKAREQLERAEKEGQTNLEKLAQAGEQQRAHLTALERLKAAQHTRRLWARLQLLLGPEGLQRALLENAQQAIIQYANTILDRLAGGQLYIAPRPRDTTAGPIRALDLIAHTTQSGVHPRDVAFLSGSQKFRVAVALALAIGQFASHASRPVQAVIIDEGFGCLDTANRSVMIQELQNLQGHLQRILLVSHQEEFVGAFPDGYRCELVKGATRLTRLHA
jgi:DNA repair exonuclease SbcCD ATPase subunit